MAMAMEKQCTFLIFDDSVQRAEVDELKAGLENSDVSVKVATMKKIVLLMMNGEQLGDLLMDVIKFVVPNEDKGLKKLLYLYLEAVEKRGRDGNLLLPMILICNMIRNDLNHPNEFVRGSALRFLSKIREKDILEPLVSSLRANLEHRHSYVRRNAVLAIYNTYKCFEDLMPDAPELIGEFIDGENDVSAKRNAFVMLCNCDQERAVQYQLGVIDTINSMGDIVQLVMLELIRKVCRQDPFQKSKYVRAVFNLQSSASNSVAFECASTLVSLSSAQTAVRTAVQAYCNLLSTHSDNNVKLIVLDKLKDLQQKHPEVLKTLIMDIIRGLASPNIDIRKKVLDLVMELVSPSSIDEVIAVLKKEIAKTQHTDTEKAPEYRQMLIQAIHNCVIKFPEIAGNVVHVLIDFLDDSNATSASDVVLFMREVVETYPKLRELVVHKLVEYFPTMKVAKVYRVALWILSEYCRTEAEIKAAYDVVKQSIGSVPFIDENTLEAAINTAAAEHKHTSPAVLADGTYASQSGIGANLQIGKDEPPSLRNLLIGGDFYVAAVTASSLAKLIMRISSLSGTSGELVNQWSAEVIAIICSIVKLGNYGITPNKMDDDCTERLWLCLMMLSDPYNKQMQEIWNEKCRNSYSQLLVEKQKVLTEEQQESKEEAKKFKAHADDLISFRQLRGKGAIITEIEDEDALDLSRATGAAEEEDFGSRLKRVTQLTGLSDAVYAEAVVTVHDYDIVLDVLVINQLNEHLNNLCLELSTVGDLKLCERPQTYALAPHAQLNIRANIKVSSTETGIIYGNIVYDLGQGTGTDSNARDAQNMVILNDIHIDIMDYITPAHCSLLQFRQMWAEFEWENKVAVNTSIIDPVKYLRHIVSCTNMQCLTHIDDDSGDCGFLAANLYAKSIFGEDALVNVSIEKQRDGALSGNLRIRSKTQGIALSLGDKITLKQKSIETSK
ncbi:coatomer subunit beta 1 [Guillardia theta CCMP2712]|uniref:Coatomer subunit beta n=2 Tax=Guillardia theta TaxID=55529 RepID=L1JN56_GUITC|nr:coatomer subunit beta 1 [Guillardia theta CCMP2712]EKX49625.1 coatomer subunit beta 1 [Guillardia theta CCMP2712]|mmetsp:Transcript_983/g.3107  ORF Transcript_983/g.3107 Transcript_983/m.3107 type:complete len:952 (+) Transcript_983:109-2964(+)|eukprot:XP_005836605.1 coatomer subunit beta 1 [Guillardia theta CCMP2712]